MQQLAFTHKGDSEENGTSSDDGEVQSEEPKAVEEDIEMKVDAENPF